MSRTLYSDAYVTLSIDDAAGVVRYVRSHQPYPSLEVLRALHDAMKAAFESLPEGTLALLIDVREAPARNDDPFESEITRIIQATLQRFKAKAILVKSAVGKLQAQRMAKERSNGELAVFANEAEALAHLRGEAHSIAPRRGAH